VRRRHR
jgi:hypothetical protein